MQTAQPDEIKRDIRDFIVSNFLYGQQVAFSDETSLLEAGIVDSTGILELITHLEQEYAIEVEQSELVPDNLDSVARIVDYLKRKKMQRDVAS